MALGHLTAREGQETGLLFAVQQAMMTYSALDLSNPFKTTEHRMLRAAVDSVNETILLASGCSEFDTDMKELVPILREDFSSEGYLLELNYNLDCSRWDESSPPAPLRLSVIFTGDYHASGILDFYHVR